MSDDLEAQIRERAYLIWERENQPREKHEEHWLRAKAEIEAERTSKKPRQAAKKSGADSPLAPKRSVSKTVARTGRRTR